MSAVDEGVVATAKIGRSVDRAGIVDIVMGGAGAVETIDNTVRPVRYVVVDLARSGMVVAENQALVEQPVIVDGVRRPKKIELIDRSAGPVDNGVGDRGVQSHHVIENAEIFDLVSRTRHGGGVDGTIGPGKQAVQSGAGYREYATTESAVLVEREVAIVGDCDVPVYLSIVIEDKR